MRTFVFEQQKVFPIRKKRESVLDRTLNKPPRWDDPDIEKFVTSNIPEANAHHTNFLNYLEVGYNTHQSIVLAPHVFWNTILNEISGYVNENTEKCRHLFTDSSDKKEISIESNSIIPPLDRFEEELRKLVPTNMDPFLPKFTTDTEQSKLANIATFMETVKQYYDYSMFCCGYNAIRVDGTMEDWIRVGDTARYLTEVLPGLSAYLNEAADTIYNLTEWVQNGNSDQIAKILTNTLIGSGGETTVAGWITKFFREVPRLAKASNFPSHIATVPYSHKTLGRDFNLCYGLFSSTLDKNGFLIPDYGYVINERLKRDNK